MTLYCLHQLGRCVSPTIILNFNLFFFARHPSSSALCFFSLSKFFLFFLFSSFSCSSSYPPILLETNFLISFFLSPCSSFSFLPTLVLLFLILS